MRKNYRPNILNISGGGGSNPDPPPNPPSLATPMVVVLPWTSSNSSFWVETRSSQKKLYLYNTYLT